MNILTNLNLTKNQLQNAVIHPLAVAPANPAQYQIYTNTVDGVIYQYIGVAWKPIGAAYQQSSSVGAVITGLDVDGNVTVTDVVDLTMDGYTPVSQGYVTDGMTLEQAIFALDTAVKNATSGGGEVNQEAWSYIKAGETTISATAKKDTFNVVGQGGAIVSANNSTKTIAVNVPIDSAMSSSSNNPVKNSVVNEAINAKYTKSPDGIPKSDLSSSVQTSLDKADNAASLNDLDNYLPLGGGTMSGSINMANNTINGVPNATTDTQPVAYGQITTTPLMTGIGLSYDGDSVTINKSYKNIKTGVTSSNNETIALANSTTAGLMSPSSVAALSSLNDRVEALEGSTVRLLYTTKTNPTQQEIQTFVQTSGYTDQTKWAGIAVVVSGSYHIWHYYSNDSIGWRDDGVDTVSQWTNTTLGIIKGSQTDGKIYAEDDGTGSVNGWDNLKSRVTNVENNKADLTDVASIPVVHVASGTISTSLTSTTVSYSGTVVGIFAKDASGNIVIVDSTIGSNSVTFTTAQVPSTAINVYVIYI